MFRVLPKDAALPLEKGNHLELNSSDLLDLEGIKIYQSLIGALQWVIQIGQFDVTTAVMMMSHFHMQAAPRKGHLEWVKWIHGYLTVDPVTVTLIMRGTSQWVQSVSPVSGSSR
jgi:hypothetical protein